MKINLEGPCNNDCVFCRVKKDRMTPKEEIIRKINSAKSEDKKIIFTGAEPTIREDIFEFLNLAKKKFKVIELQTNGRKLSDLNFAKQIIKSGVNSFKIPLHGYPDNVHNGITRRRKSFEETIQGIKNLVKLGKNKILVVSVDINRTNYKNFPDLIKFLKGLRVRELSLSFAEELPNFPDLIKFLKGLRVRELSFEIGKKPEEKIGFNIQLNKNLAILNPDYERTTAPLAKLSSFLSQLRYDLIFDFIVKIKNLPYCLIPEPESVVLKEENSNLVKFENCQKCRYFENCPGILEDRLKNFDIKKLRPERLPKEVMIEVEPSCNFNCKFCFNRSSFAAKNDFFKKKLSTEYVKKIIDNLAKSKIPIVRFTGGEPLLRKDIYDLIDYAKNKGLEVRLNTNGSLIKSYRQAKWLAKRLSYVLFSMHTYDPNKDEGITGFKNSFYLKTRATKWLKKAGIKTIRISTIATYDNIRNLEKFYEILKDLGVDKWAVNRIIPILGQKDTFSKKQLAMLVEKLLKIRKDIVKNKIPLKVHIVNGVPFCGYDPVKVNAVASGARSVDGHERFAIDPRGFAKPIYYLDVNIGDPLKPLECWNHPYMKKLRSYEILPRECKDCILIEKCKGGNRYCAYAASKKRKNAPDPLMNFEKYKDILLKN